MDRKVAAYPINRTTANGLDDSIAAIASSLDPDTRQAASIAVSDRVAGVRLDASARAIFTDAQVQP